MKRITRFLAALLAIGAALAVIGPKPAYAGGVTLGNQNDPDWAYSPSSGTLIDLSTVSASAAGTVVTSTSPSIMIYRNLEIVAQLQGNTGGTMDMYLQTSPDNGLTWYDYIHFPQRAAGAAVAAYHTTVARDGGQTATPIVVGAGIVPALAANAVVGGSFGTMLRVVIVSGGGTTVGKPQTISMYASM